MKRRLPQIPIRKTKRNRKKGRLHGGKSLSTDKLFSDNGKKLAGSLVLLSVFLNCGTARAISLISDEETEIFLHQTLRPVFNAAGVAFRPGQIYIVNDRELNAFVTDGNRMFVNIGTITAADSQNELTGVLAHETGHIQGGHILRHKIKSREVQSISLASMLVAAWPALPPDVQT